MTVQTIPTTAETGLEAWRDRIKHALRDSGIPTGAVAIEGLTTQGYYEIGKDHLGRPTAFWKPWPDNETKGRIMKALRGQQS